MSERLEQYVVRVLSGALLLLALYLLTACGILPNAAPPNPFQLDKTKWTLTAIMENGAASPLASSMPTLEFQTDTLGGNAGCHRYGGAYTTQGKVIQIELLRATLMACADAEVMAQETAYQNALQNARLFAVRDNTLKMPYGDGKGQLGFERRDK
jgi:heat shock protein HslJ